jgi:ACS family tartrate transporter-like MFS transporter
MAKIWWRLVPLISAGLLLNLIDRTNIAFAGLQMNAALRLSNSGFGLGAGFFAIGILLFGLPSTLLLERFGARRWIGGTLIAWGLLSGATAFVRDLQQLLIVRLLLGVAEAGFVPGVILYFSYWFPSAYRGRVLGAFIFMQPVALILGSPICAALVGHGVFGLAGWQFMLIAEALPTIILGLAIYRCLPSKPAEARWLSAAEHRWLEERLQSERRADPPKEAGGGVRRVLGMPRVWTMAAVYLAIVTSGTGLIFFIPLIIRSMAFSILETGFVAPLPWIAGALVMPLWGTWVDRVEDREIVVAASTGALALGLLFTALLLPSRWAIAPFTFAMVGLCGFLPTFWTVPYRILTGATIAAGIGFINVIGNSGNLIGPYLVGSLTDATGGYGGGLVGMAAFAAIGTFLLLAQRRINHRAQAQGAATAIRDCRARES